MLGTVQLILEKDPNLAAGEKQRMLLKNGRFIKSKNKVIYLVLREKT